MHVCKAIDSVLGGDRQSRREEPPIKVSINSIGSIYNDGGVRYFCTIHHNEGAIDFYLWNFSVGFVCCMGLGFLHSSNCLIESLEL